MKIRRANYFPFRLLPILKLTRSMRILYSGHYFMLNYFSSSDRSTGSSGSNSSQTRLLSQLPLLLAHRRQSEYRFSFSLCVIVYNCHSAVKVMRTVKLGFSRINVTSGVYSDPNSIYVLEISNIIMLQFFLWKNLNLHKIQTWQQERCNIDPVNSYRVWEIFVMNKVSSVSFKF